MKTIIRLFAAVLTAVPVLVSCYSEPLPEVIPEVIPEDGGNGSEQDTTARVIIVSFDTKATRTEFSKEGDYLSQPIFEKGDEIYVANGTGFDTPEVEYKNIGGKNVATISTTLSGSLKLVYPSNCVKLGHSEVIDEGTVWVQNPNEIAGIIVPPVQTGYFKDANICMAEMEAGDTKAIFHNQTAVFVIDVPTGAKGLEVTSLRTINNATGQRFIAYEDPYNNCWSTISCEWNGKNLYSARRTITIGNGSSALPDPCFVSIMVEEDDGVLLRDLNFDVQTLFFEGEVQEGGTGLFPGAGYQGGFSPYFLNKTFGTGSADTKRVQKGAIYTGVEKHLHEYVNGGNTKWSTKYLGLQGDSTNEVGYFAWGETTGHKWNGTSFESVDGTTGYTFSWATCPFNDGKTYYNSTSFDANTICPKAKNPSNPTSSPSSTLRLDYDAAYYNWGGAWRMIRNIDQIELEESFDWDGFTASSDKRGTITFSPVGYAANDGTLTNSSNVYFWTATYSAVQAEYYLQFNLTQSRFSAYKNTPVGYRYSGLAIRPVVGIEIQ